MVWTSASNPATLRKTDHGRAHPDLSRGGRAAGACRTKNPGSLSHPPDPGRSRAGADSWSTANSPRPPTRLRPVSSSADLSRSRLDVVARFPLEPAPHPSPGDHFGVGDNVVHRFRVPLPDG